MLRHVVGADQGAVGGDAVAGAGEQVLDIDGDDHRRRRPTRIRHGVGAEESVADVFEGVVHPLPVVPLIRGFDQPPVRAVTRLVRGFAKGPSRACSLAPRGPVSRSVPAQDPSRH